MYIIKFTREGETEPKLFSCGECKLLTRVESNAEECCKPRKCSVCNAIIERFRTLCPEHIEAKNFEEAKKIEEVDWDGPVTLDEQFFSSVSEAKETLFDKATEHECAPPVYVYACEEMIGFSIDPADIKENLCVDMEDGFEIDGIDEVYDFCAKWNKNQKQKWWLSTTKLVLLDWENYKS